jgi:hypothetical protein
MGPIQALRGRRNPHRIIPLLVEAPLRDRIARMPLEDIERTLEAVIKDCVQTYRSTQHPIETYTAYEYVSEVFDVHATLKPRALGIFHLLLAYLLITGFSSAESITVARDHSAVAIEILARRVQLSVEGDADPLSHALWLHSICEKMLGLASDAHDELVNALRDRHIVAARTVVGVVPLIRQLALIEQTADSFAAVAELLEDLPLGSVEYFHSARRLAEFHLNAGRHKLASNYLKRAIASYSLIGERLDAVHKVALLKNTYQLLLNQQSPQASAIGRRALREAQRLGLSGQIMQLHAITNQYLAGHHGIILPPAQFQSGSTEANEEKPTSNQ